MQHVTRGQLLDRKNPAPINWENILKDIGYGIIVVDHQGHILFYNEQARRVHRDFTFYDISFCLNLLDSVPDFRRTELKKFLNEAASGSNQIYEVQYPNGKWLEVSLFKTNGDSYETEVCCKLRDISQRKNEEIEIREAKEKYQSLFNSMVEAVIFQSGEKFKSAANDSACAILGVPREKLAVDGLASSALEWLDQCEKSISFKNLFQPIFDGRLSIRGKILGLKKNNTISWISLNAEPIKKNEPGSDYLFTFVDITDTYAIQKELRILSQVVQETSNIVVITDKNERIRWANESFYTTYGYSAEEVLNKKPGQLLGGPDKDRNESRKIREAISNGRAVDGEILNYSKTGKKFWFQYHIHPVKDENGDVVQFFSIQSDITEKKKLHQEMLEKELKQQKQIAIARLKAQEERQTQIGQELHDNINQILAATQLHAGMILKDSVNIKKHAGSVNDYLKLAITEIRKLSHQLVLPRFSDKNFFEHISALLGSLNSNISTSLVNNLREDKLTADQKLALYRIVQELLNNITKHANARSVELNFAETDGRIQLLVADDGIGFDKTVSKNGIGLSNIFNRAEALNGSVSFETAPGRGCRVLIHLPC